MRRTELERDLSRNEPSVDLSNRFRTADAAAILARLSPGVMLIEYVRFDLVDFRNLVSSPLNDAKTGRYCAFALFRIESGEPLVNSFNLGDAVDLERRVQEFRQAIVDVSDSVREYGDDLRRHLLDPIISLMGEPQALIVAGDAAINSIPFDALVWTDGRWLLDALPVTFVDVGRDVLRFGHDRPGNEPVVIAAPDFDLRDVPDLGPLASGPAAFSHLTGAEKEGRAVAVRLGVEPLMGRQAVESALRNVRSPKILHLATHGFFIPKVRYEGQQDLFDSITILQVPGEGDFLVSAKRPDAQEDPELLIHASRLENPLLRSGIVLAGANTWLAEAPFL